MVEPWKSVRVFGVHHHIGTDKLGAATHTFRLAGQTVLTAGCSVVDQADIICCQYCNTEFRNLNMVVSLAKPRSVAAGDAHFAEDLSISGVLTAPYRHLQP